MAKSVKIAIIGDASGLKGAVQESEGILDGFGKKLGGIATALGAAFATEKIAGFAKDAIGAASDLNEALSKNDVVFGQGAKSIAEAAKGAYQTVGLSEKAYAELAGTVGVLGKSAGLAGDDLAAFGKEAIQRAADIGSFNNAATSDVIEAWGAAMRGEMEPMRKFGVLLDDATMRTEAMKMGLVKNTKDALTPQTKALVANALIMKQTTDAAGDFARTSDGLANKQRILGAKIENLKTTIGKALLPIFSKVVGFISDHLQPAFESLGRHVLPVFKAIGDAVKLFVGTFTGAGANVSNLSGGMMDKIITFGDKARTVFDWVTSAIKLFIGGFTGAGSEYGAVSAKMGDKIISFADKVRTAFDWIVKTGLPALKTAFVAVFEFIKGTVIPIVATIVGGIITGLSAAVAWVVENWPKFQAAVMAVFDWIVANVVPKVVGFVGYLIEQFGNLVAWVKQFWPSISEAIGHVVNAIADVIGWLVDVATRIWNMWGENILGIAKAIWETIVGVIKGAIDTVRNIIKFVVDLINGDWDKAWHDLLGIVSGVWEQIWAVLRGAIGIVVEVAKAIWKPVSDALSVSWDFIKGIWDTIIGFVTGLPKRVASAAAGMWDGIKDAFKGAVNWIIRKWNALSFTVGGGSFLGVDIPKMTLGVPQIPELADGGIVNRPTLALIGEAGPEAVVPLRKSGGGMGGGSVVFNVMSTDPKGTIDVLQQAVRVNGADAVRRVLGIAA